MMYLNTKTPVKDGDLVWVIPYQYFNGYQDCWPEGNVGVIRVETDKYFLDYVDTLWDDLEKPHPGDFKHTAIEPCEVVFRLSPVSTLDKVLKGMLLYQLSVTEDGGVYDFNIVRSTATVDVTEYTVVLTEQPNLLHDDGNSYPVKELYYIEDDSVPNGYYKGEWEVEALPGDIVDYNDEEAVVLKLYPYHDKALIRQGGIKSLVDISELRFVRPRAIRLGDRVVIGSRDTTANGEVIPTYNLISTKTPVYKVIKILEKDCYILKNKETGGEFIAQACSLTLLQPREVCSPNEPTLDIL